MPDLIAYQKLAVALLEAAANGERGRSETDSFYVQQITEGRDRGAMRRTYSSCGDVPHWMLYRAGVRVPWINRAEHEGWRWTRPGRPANNVNLLMGGFNPLAVRVRADTVWEPGDAGVIFDRHAPRHTHVFCVVRGAGGGRIQTCEGGQPGVELFDRAIARGRLCVVRDDGSLRPGRELQWRVPFRDVIQAAGLADAEEPLLQPDGSVLWRPWSAEKL